MTKTPDHQLPTIKEASTIGLRFTVGTWCAILGGVGTSLVLLVGFCIWLNTMHEDVQSMKGVQLRQADTLERVEALVREIEFRQKYGITAGLPNVPKATP